MKWLVAALAVSVLVSTAHCASDAVEWCYHLPTCNYTTWPTIAPNFCNGTRQSPIDIVTANVTGDSSLTAFNFFNYNDTSAIDKIENTGKTVKALLKSGVQISGGGLTETYDSLQFHLHWGNGSSDPGSEHTVDGKRFPMELHIVNAKASFSGNTTLAVEDSEGLAALGFFIELGVSNDAWKTLLSYLASIPFKGDIVSVAHNISLDDLLDGVDRTRYWRYLGSLTTPNCNEAVVWTVFKDTIKLGESDMLLFSSLYIGMNSSSVLMTDVYRGVQPAQRVTTQLSLNATTVPSTTATTQNTSSDASSASKACFSLGMMALSLALGRL